jgi:hypothetical protein
MYDHAFHISFSYRHVSVFYDFDVVVQSYKSCFGM